VAAKKELPHFINWVAWVALATVL